MWKKSNDALVQSEETKEELIGILNAISVVSKRLAKKLQLVEPMVKKKKGRNCDARRT